MKKHKITLNEYELKELAIYLKVKNDLEAGKVEEIANKGFAYFIYNLDVETIGKMFARIKKIKFPKFKKREYLKEEDFSEEMKIREYMSQKLKNLYAYSKNTEGGVTNWFTKAKKPNDVNIHLLAVEKDSVFS